MAKVMLFIDGTWLYSNTGRLAESFGKPGFQIDFGKLPQTLAGEVRKQLGNTEVDVVRTYLFGSYAANYDPQDGEAVQRRLDFFDMLKEEFHYEVETYPINFLGRRLRRVDRDPNDDFEPREKCVDISLATSMLYFAAIPYAYDIAIAVVGDQDFKPVLQHVRRLGKRVAIASIRQACAADFADPRDGARVKDFDIMWLNDLLADLELRYEPHQLDCESPTHRGPRKVWTTFHPRKGKKFYCDECRARFARDKQEAQEQSAGQTLDAPPEGFPIEEVAVGQVFEGVLKKIVQEKGFGFIRSPGGKDFFFHMSDLAPGLEFDVLEPGMRLDCEVVRLPGEDKEKPAGAVRNVRGVLR